MNDRMTDRQLRGGAAVIAVEGTERSQQNARLQLAWLALRARNQALAYGSHGSRFALAIKRTPRRLVVASSSKYFGFKFGFEFEFKFGFESRLKFGFIKFVRN